MLQPVDAFASIQCSKLRLRPGLRSGPLLSGFKRAESEGEGVKGEKEGRGREPGKSRGQEKKGKGGKGEGREVETGPPIG